MDIIDRKDFFFKEAKREGYLARSAYKILLIDKKYKFLSKINNVLELGSSPGSWSQVFTKYKIKVRAIDREDMKFHSSLITFSKSDIYSNDWIEDKMKFDMIASDIAHDSGCKSVYDIQNTNLLERVEELLFLLNDKGYILIKTFHSPYLKEYIDRMKKIFRECKLVKPEACRKSEIYLFGSFFKE